MKRIGSTRKGKKVIAGFSVLLLLLVSLAVIQDRVLGLVDETEVEILSIRILRSTGDSLDLELDVIIDNPASFGVKTEYCGLELRYHGIYTGDLFLDPMKLDSGENNITITAELAEHNPDMMRSMADYLLNYGNVTIEIVGDISLGGWTPIDLPMKKEITLKRFSSPNITVTSVDIMNSSEEGITGEVHAIVSNSGNMETTLEGLEFMAYHSSGFLGNLTASGYLDSGENEVTLSLDIPAASTDVGKQVVSDLMNGGGMSINIQGGGNPDYLLSRLASTYSYQYTENESTNQVGSIGELGVEIENIEISDTDDSGMHGEVSALVSNPSIIGVNLDGLEFQLSFNGSHLAVLSSSGNLVPGENTITFDLFIPAHASEAYNALAGDILDGGNYSFQLIGSEVPGHPLSTLATAYSYTYELEVTEHVSTDVTSLDLSPGLFTTIIDATALLSNPTPVTMNLEPFQLTAYYQGNYLGPISLDNHWIVPGNQTIDLSMSVSTIRLQNIGLAGKLLLGIPIDLVIEAKHTFDEENVFSVTITATVGDTVPGVRGPVGPTVRSPTSPAVPGLTLLPDSSPAPSSIPDVPSPVLSPIQDVSNIVPEKVYNPVSHGF